MDEATLPIFLTELRVQFSARSVAGGRWRKARRYGDGSLLSPFAGMQSYAGRIGAKVDLRRTLASIGRIAILGCIAIISSEAMAQDKLKKLTGPQIRATIAGMQMTDETHWRYVYERNGTLRTQAMGRARAGR